MPMPQNVNSREFYHALISLAGSTLYPIALGLLIPVFMYTIVLEKEERL